jgi:hypothetical protein
VVYKPNLKRGLVGGGPPPPHFFGHVLQFCIHITNFQGYYFQNNYSFLAIAK